MGHFVPEVVDDVVLSKRRTNIESFESFVRYDRVPGSGDALRLQEYADLALSQLPALSSVDFVESKNDIGRRTEKRGILAD